MRNVNDGEVVSEGRKVDDKGVGFQSRVSWPRLFYEARANANVQMRFFFFHARFAIIVFSSRRLFVYSPFAYSRA